jgi:hypothetical protein
MSFREINRDNILNDERVQRLKKIRLLERENRENLPKFQEKQAQAFPTALPLSNTPSLGQIITEESQKTAIDPGIVYQRAESKILQIAPKLVTEYILDRLTDKDLYYMVNSWDGISKKLREQFATKGLDKDIFIKMVKIDAKKFDTDLGTTETGLSNRGLLRQNQLETEADELTAKMAVEKQKQDDDRKAFNDLVNEREIRKNAEVYIKSLKDGIINQRKAQPKTIFRDEMIEREPKVYNPSNVDIAEGKTFDVVEKKQIKDKNANRNNQNLKTKIIPTKFNNNDEYGVEESKEIPLPKKTSIDEYKAMTNQGSKKNDSEKLKSSEPVDNEPFKATDSNQLSKEYQDYYFDNKDKIREQVNKVSIEEVNDIIKEYETKSPTKMKRILARDPREKLIKFLERTMVNDLYLTQEQSSPSKSIEENQTFISDEENLNSLKKIDLLKMAKAIGVEEKFSSRTSNKGLISLILEKSEPGEINDYIQGMDSNSTPNLSDYDLNNMKRDDLIILAKDSGLSKYYLRQNNTAIIRELESLRKKASDTGLLEGLGIKKQKRRKIVGRGSSDSEVETRKEFNGKFIDLKKLKENILTIKYCKTGTYIPNVKSQHISNDTKEVINDLLNQKFDNRLFDKLAETDKRLIKRVIKAFSLNIDLNDTSIDEYRKQYDILLGQFRSGNNSPLIKNKLKEYIIDSNESGLLTRREMWNLLHELVNA